MRKCICRTTNRPTRRPYLVLLPVGFTVPSTLPQTRCALTAPFHPYPQSVSGPDAGGLLSVALSLGSPPPGVTRHRISVEPGLSSIPFREPRSSGRLAARSIGDEARFRKASLPTHVRQNRRFKKGYVLILERKVANLLAIPIFVAPI